MAKDRWSNSFASVLADSDMWGLEGYEQAQHILRFALPEDDEQPPSDGQLAMCDAYVLISKLIYRVLEGDERLRQAEERLARVESRINGDDVDAEEA